jgi:hypothetical protein
MYRGDLLYAAKGVDSASYGGETVCLLVYTELSEKWSTVCGHGPIGVGDGFRDYTLRIDGAPIPEGAVQVTPNVFVIEERETPAIARKSWSGGCRQRLEHCR